MKQILATIHWPRLTLIFVMAVVIFTITGPFGSYESLSAGPRLLYWTVLMTGCGLFIHLGITFAIYMPALSHYPRFLRLLIGVAIASIPATLVVAGVEHFIRERLMDFYPLLWWRLWSTVAAVSVIIGHFNFMPPFARLQILNKLPSIDIDRIPFLKRLPKEIGTALISISMEDHYARVITLRGEALVHVRLSEAISELKNYPGRQIHRSHWVALDSIVGIERNNRRLIVKTSNGEQLPVSNSYENNIRDQIEAFLNSDETV